MFSILNVVQSDIIHNITILNEPAPGLLKFDYVFKQQFGLVDNYGFYVNIKEANKGNQHIRMLKNGNYSQFAYNKYIIYNSNLEIIDSIQNPTPYILDYHDFISLNNGHYLMLLNHDTIVDMSKFVEGGQKNAIIINNILVETDRSGTIYWYWDAFKNLDILDVTRDINLKYNAIDFAHINSMFEDLNGNILISIRHYDELALINKSGGFVWRLGGYESKKNQFTFVNDVTNGFYGFSHQHTAEILSNGNILLFDNGNLKNPPISRAVEYNFDVSSKTVTKVWEYYHSTSIYSSAMGSTQRLQNGNTLINWSKGIITEVRPDKTVTFELVLPNDASIYRAQKVQSFMKTVSKNLTSSAEYSFSDFNNNTGVSINVQNINGAGMAHLQMYDYAPHYMQFADSSFSSIFPYRWLFTSDGSIGAINGKFKLNLSAITGFSDATKLTIFKRDKETIGNFIELNTTYNSMTNELIADFSGFGEFIICTSKLLKIELLSPLNNSYVNISGLFKWKKVTGALAYQIMISKDIEFNTIVKSEEIVGMEECEYKDLEYNQIYYWKVRALNAKDTSDWSITFKMNTEVKAPELIYPTNAKIGLKLSDSVKWSEVPGADSYQLQISSGPTFQFLIVNDKNIKKNYKQISNLSNNFEYKWRVRAFKGIDSSLWSEVRTFSTCLASPILTFPANGMINISNELEFSWSKVDGGKTYLIQLSEDENFSAQSTKKFNSFEPKIILSDIKLNRRYFWRVKAENNNDSSEWSEIYDFYTLLNPPALISPPDNQKEVEADVTLYWTSDSDKPIYQLTVAKDNYLSDIVIDTLLNDVTFFKFDELKAKTTYFWQVKIFDGDLESSWSDIRKFTVGKGFLLAAPKLVFPPNSSEGLSEGELHWAKRMKAISYRIQVSNDFDFKSNLIDVAKITSTEYAYKNLNVGQNYYWRVKAYTLYDSTNWSETWNFSIVKPHNIITLKSPGNDALQVPIDSRLEWVQIADYDYYTLHISQDDKFNEIKIDKNIYENNTYNLENFETNTTYYWRVRFVKDSEISDWSDVWSFTTETAIVLDIPQITSPLDGSVAVPIIGDVTWESVIGASEYLLSFSNQLNFSTILFKQSSIIDTKLEYSNLDYGTKYYLRVAAASKKSMSNWSIPLSFLTELEPPIIKIPNESQEKYKSNGVIIWDISKNIDFYHLQISLDENFENFVEDKKNIDELMYEYFLDDNTTYFCRVKSYNDSNYSRWSKTISFTTDNATSVETDEQQEEFSIYPNPVSDYIYFNLSSGIENGNITIYDILGNIVKSVIMQENADNQMINIKNLPSGTYFIKYLNKEKIFVKE